MDGVRGFLERMANRAESKRRLREYEFLLGRGYSVEGAARSINARFGPSITPQTMGRTVMVTFTPPAASSLSGLVVEFSVRSVPRSRKDRTLLEIAEEVEGSLGRAILTAADVVTIELSVAATQFLHGLVSGAISMVDPDNPEAGSLVNDLVGARDALEHALRRRSDG